MSEKTVIVTGANRGIGLSFCKLYAEKGLKVIALCRHSSKELETLSVEIIPGCDLAQPYSLPMVVDTIGNRTIHLLINNAGILRDEVLGSLNFETIEEQLKVNALGPLRLTELLMPNLENPSKIAMITSRMGSIADNTSGGRYGYRMSKAALNIASVSLAKDLRPKGVAVGIFHPGLVGTDMIGGHGDITPDEAATRLIKRIEGLSLENSGTFWHSNGDLLPW